MADDRSGAPSPEGSLGGTAADGDAQDTPVSSPAGDTGSVEPGKPAKGAKAAKAAKGAGKSASAKSAKGKRPASAAGAGAGAAGGHLILAEHPRAVSGIARAKAWGGLGGFLLGGYLSLPTHTLPEAGLRALAAGVICYLAAWGAAVFLWQRLVVAELRDAQQELLATELAKLNRTSDGAAAAPQPGRPRVGV